MKRRGLDTESLPSSSKDPEERGIDEKFKQRHSVDVHNTKQDVGGEDEKEAGDEIADKKFAPPDKMESAAQEDVDTPRKYLPQRTDGDSHDYYESTTEGMKERWDTRSRCSVVSSSRTQKAHEDDLGEPPVDKFRVAFFIILLHGIGVLLPWNMFITIAPNYYVEYWFTVNGTKTSYAKSFMSALGITAQIPNFLLSLINLMQIIGGSLMIRIAGPLLLNCLNVVVILALVIFQDPSVDAMQWFYIVSLIIVMVMNASNGLYQNSVYGLTADFPAVYTNALVVGNNICGTFTSVLSIVTTVGFPNNYKAVALVYFAISLATLILCELSLILLTRLKFYKYYLEKGKRSRLAQNVTRPSLSQFMETFKNSWMQLLSVFLVFFVTLAVFPTVLAGTVPYKKGEPWNSIISKEIYPGITTFLNFNLLAMIGSTTANFIQIPGPNTLLIPVVARLLFIPYFMLCNYNVDDRVMPVLFQNEWFFIVGNTVMAFTSGYFSSLAMMYAPRVVPDSLSKTAGMAAALCLVTGVMAGVSFTPLITVMVNNIG